MSTAKFVHEWGPRLDGVVKCQRPGCTVESKNSVPPTRAVGFRATAEGVWSFRILPCTGKAGQS